MQEVIKKETVSELLLCLNVEQTFEEERWHWFAGLGKYPLTGLPSLHASELLIGTPVTRF